MTSNNNFNAYVKASLFKTISKLEESQKMETAFKKDANLLITHQKLTRIDSFTGYFNFLHNNYLTPVYYEGITYPSVTHAYHAARSTDQQTRKAILNAETFQILGNIAIRISDPLDWQERKLKLMEQLLRDKFRRCKDLQDKLRLTLGRELLMTYEEEKKNNLYWGVVKGKGQNQLGRILMKIRNDIINDVQQYQQTQMISNSIEILNWINCCYNLVEDIQFIPEIKLTVNKSNKTIDHIVLANKALFKIGLYPHNDLVLAHPSISRLHAVIIVDSSLGVVLIDLNSKGGTKLDGETLTDHVPYKLKTGKKITFALSSRDYIVEIDLSRVKRVYQREQMKIDNNITLIKKLDFKDKEVIEQTFGVSDNNGKGVCSSNNSNYKNDTIFVKHIPFNAGESTIKQLFENQFGKINNIYWPKDNETGFKLNYAFIQFESVDSAKKAVDYGLIAFTEEEGEEDIGNGGTHHKISCMLKIAYAVNAYKYNMKNQNRRKERRRYKYNRSRSRSRSSKYYSKQKRSNSSSRSYSSYSERSWRKKGWRRKGDKRRSGKNYSSSSKHSKSRSKSKSSRSYSSSSSSSSSDIFSAETQKVLRSSLSSSSSPFYSPNNNNNNNTNNISEQNK